MSDSVVREAVDCPKCGRLINDFCPDCAYSPLNEFEEKLRAMEFYSYPTGGNQWAWRRGDIFISSDGDFPDGSTEICVWTLDSDNVTGYDWRDFGADEYDLVLAYVQELLN